MTFFYFRFLIGLHVFGDLKHDLTVFVKCLSRVGLFVRQFCGQTISSVNTGKFISLDILSQNWHNIMLTWFSCISLNRWHSYAEFLWFSTMSISRYRWNLILSNVIFIPSHIYVLIRFWCMPKPILCPTSGTAMLNFYYVSVLSILVIYEIEYHETPWWVRLWYRIEMIRMYIY